MICTFCGFRVFFLNQLPDFRELNVCQDWVKFSYLLNGFVSWFLCISQKYKTSLYHNWESEVDFKSLSDVSWLLWSEGLWYHIALDIPNLTCSQTPPFSFQPHPQPGPWSLLLSITESCVDNPFSQLSSRFLFVTETSRTGTSESHTYPTAHSVESFFLVLRPGTPYDHKKLFHTSFFRWASQLTLLEDLLNLGSTFLLIECCSSCYDRDLVIPVVFGSAEFILEYWEVLLSPRRLVTVSWEANSPTEPSCRNTANFA